MAFQSRFAIPPCYPSDIADKADGDFAKLEDVPESKLIATRRIDRHHHHLLDQQDSKRGKRRYRGKSDKGNDSVSLRIQSKQFLNTLIDTPFVLLHSCSSVVRCNATCFYHIGVRFCTVYCTTVCFLSFSRFGTLTWHTRNGIDYLWRGRPTEA